MARTICVRPRPWRPHDVESRRLSGRARDGEWNGVSAPVGARVAAGPSALVRSGQASTIEPFQREMTPPTPTPEAAHNPTMNVSRETSTELTPLSALQQNAMRVLHTTTSRCSGRADAPGAHHRNQKGVGSTTVNIAAALAVW